MGNIGKCGAFSSVNDNDVVTVELESPILDIFSSRQGEGICVGDPHIFVRFGGCNVACDYCDTPESIPAGSGRPQDVHGVLEQITALDQGRRATAVSLTGGEPLLQVGFLERLIP